MEGLDEPGRLRLESLDFLNTNLKDSIMAATLLAKTLVCFVTDESESSSQWQTILSDDKYRPRLIAETVTLKINAGTQEAQYLHGVCPLNGVPAMVLVKRGAITHNLQHPQETSADLRTRLDTLFAPVGNGQDYSLYEDQSQDALELIPWYRWIQRLPHFAWIMQFTDHVFKNRTSGTESRGPTNNTLDDPAVNPYAYIVLPSSAGRMRLPNNAYDMLGVLTQKWLDQDIRGDNVLRMQLRTLKNIPAMADAVAAIENRSRNALPTLNPEHQSRLLNTPANSLNLDRPAAPSRNGSSGSQSPHSAVGTSATQLGSTSSSVNDRPSGSEPPVPDHRSRQSPPVSAQPPRSSNVPTSTNVPTSGSTSSNEQRNDYVRRQREREASERAERERIKAQIASDRVERRRLEEVRRQNERKVELESLRQANSTTSNPQGSDIRIQVRTFSGSTIRTSFKRDATISSIVRPWIDDTTRNITPYNLKWIRTPLPNYTVEAGEEEQTLSDLGFVGSATMVMVPVKGYVDSYAGSAGGLVGVVTGAVGGVLGGIGSFIGWGGSANTSAEARDTAEESRAAPSLESKTPNDRVRVRTLADQRAEEAKKRSNELYNGNQLNFQGRGDDDNKDD